MVSGILKRIILCMGRKKHGKRDKTNGERDSSSNRQKEKNMAKNKTNKWTKALKSLWAERKKHGKNGTKTKTDKEGRIHALSVSVSSQTREMPITRLVGICHKKTLAQQTATNDGRFDCSNRNRTARALFLKRQKHLLQREELHVEEAICIELQRRRSSSKQA